jgi:hypothetical protein
MAFLCIVKEPFIAIPIGLLIWEFVSGGLSVWRRRRREILLLLATLLPLVGWWTYVRSVFDEWPFAQSWLVEKPVYGYLDTMFKASVLSSAGGDQSQIGIPSLAFVLTIGLALLFATAHAIRVRTPIDAMFLVFLGIASILSWWQLLYAKELFRILAIPLLLLPAVYAGHTGRWRPPERIGDADGV